MARPALARARELAAGTRNDRSSAAVRRGRRQPPADLPVRRRGVVLRDRPDQPLPVRAVASAAGGAGRLGSGSSSSSTGPTPGSRCWPETALPVAFAAQLRRAGAAGRATATSGSCSTSTRWSRTSGCSASATAVHVQMGHGESDKDGSLSNQHQAYDLTFVGGEVGRDRLRALRFFDADARTRLSAGRSSTTATPGRRPGRRRRDACVLRPHLGRGEGRDPVRIVGQPRAHAGARPARRSGVRIIYRPHPRTGTGVGGAHGG